MSKAVDDIEEEVPEDIQAVLDTIDAQLKKIQKVLRKVEPIIARRDKLMAARRVLLSTRSTTGGAGSPRTRLSMDEVVNVMKSVKGKKQWTAPEIADKLGLEATIVRSHLNRHAGERYEQVERGVWSLAEEG